MAKKYQEEIKQVCQTAAARNAIQAFENIYIHADNDGTIKIKAGDSMVEITRTLVAESFESGFETTVNALKFLQAFNACPNDVKIVVKDKMTINIGLSEAISIITDDTINTTTLYSGIISNGLWDLTFKKTIL